MFKLNARSRRALVYLLVWVLAALAVAPTPASTRTPDAAPSSDETRYLVSRVVDGDTIDVQKDGTIIRVRLIGLDTPETVDPRKPIQCFGAEASAEAHRILAGQTVRLETDPSQDTHDKYGRLLAYAFLPDGSNVAEHLIADGFGHEYTYDMPYRYQKEFRAAEATARAAGRGLWASGTCGK